MIDEKIKVGAIFKLKPGAYGSGRWGDSFKIRKITDHNVICGFWVRRGYPQQHGCIKLEDFKEMIE